MLVAQLAEQRSPRDVARALHHKFRALQVLAVFEMIASTARVSWEYIFAGHVRLQSVRRIGSVSSLVSCLSIAHGSFTSALDPANGMVDERAQRKLVFKDIDFVGAGRG